MPERAGRDARGEDSARPLELLFQIGFQAARGIMWVSLAFLLVVVSLMTANYVQIRSAAPLDNPALEQARERLLQNPDEELASEIRLLDIMARKAYFTRQWQLGVGAYLLMGGAAAFLLGLGVRRILQPRIVQPAPSEDTGRSAQWSQYGIAGLAGVLLIAGGLFGYLLPSRLPGPEASAGGAEPGAAAPGATSAGAAGSTDAPAAAAATGSESGAQAFPGRDELARNWPYFRGFGAGSGSQTGAVPVHWDGVTGEGILWRTVIPRPGFNSPVVWDERLYLSGADEETREVYCFDASTGEILWVSRVEGVPGSASEAPEVTEDTGYAAPSLATDGRRVFALFANGDLVCIDRRGEAVWSRNLGLPDNHYGHSSSLLIHRGLLLVQYDHETQARLLALASKSGEVVWEQEREVVTSWASPILVDIGERTAVVLNANPYVAAYDADTGEELWRAMLMMGEVAPSPAYGGGTVFAANEFAVLMALDAETGELLWEEYDDLPNVSSPVASDEYVFIVASYGVVACRDVNDGTLVWQKEFDSDFYSSPVLAGGLVYLLDRQGVMTVFRAGPSYEEVARSRLGEQSDCTPAFAGGRIYIRGKTHLYCIGTEDPGESR